VLYAGSLNDTVPVLVSPVEGSAPGDKVTLSWKGSNASAPYTKSSPMPDAGYVVFLVNAEQHVRPNIGGTVTLHYTWRHANGDEETSSLLSLTVSPNNGP
jgi:hypothetical protein